MKLSKIKNNPENPRIIKDFNFKKLCNSIKSLPKMMELRPIIVDENFIVQGGNMRLKALQELGYKEIPDTWVKQANDFTEEELREFIVKDNVGYGDWDWDMIANEWDTEKLKEWGLDIPSFNIPIEEPEIDKDLLSKDMDSYINNTIKQIVLYFETDKYIDVLNNLNRIAENEGLNDNSEVVEFLIEKHLK